MPRRREKFEQLDLTGTTQQLEIWSAAGRTMPKQVRAQEALSLERDNAQTDRAFAECDAIMRGQYEPDVIFDDEEC